MAHALPLPVPCPVQLGSIKGDSLEAQLHDYVRQGNYVKVKKLLKKGISVDAVNSMGQTSLFVAALLGLGKIVDVLLDYDSDANHRCYDGSTPVHAAAFSGNQWILSKLLEAGGDLRVHDEAGKNPQNWAMSSGKESSAQMLEFIQNCTFHMQAAVQNFPSHLLRKVGSSKALVCNSSRFGVLVQGNVESPLGRLLKGGANAAKNIYSFGFGKILGTVAYSFWLLLVVFQFYLAGGRHLGYLASLPIIGEKDVLRHPHLLQLMSVCLSSDLEKTRLVYERVTFGSLYSILHERRTEFPVLHMETVLHVLLQISDALRFLHSRGFIHRSVTSYAIQIVSSGEAKLCNLEYMIESKDGGEHSDLTRIPVPVQLYKWCSPEVILEKVVTVKSDIYSFCTVVQEALTETPPWKGLEDSVIKQLIISGQELEADVRLPMPYYDIIKSGLEPKQKNRTIKLQDIQYILKNDLKDLTKSQTGHADEMSKAQGRAVFADVNICLTSAFSYWKRTQELQGKEVTEADSSGAPRSSVFPEDNSALVDQEASVSLQPVAQDKNAAASELQETLSVSDVDDSLRSFEINEIFASFSDLQDDFLEEVAGLGQTLKDEKSLQKEEGPPASPGVHCEEKTLYEESDFTELSAENTTEEEEKMNEASAPSMLAQVRGDAGRRMSNLYQNEQHISKCVLNLKIVQSMLQQAAASLCRTQEKLDRLEAAEKQKKLLQEMGMNQLSKQIFQERHWNRSDDNSQNTNYPFSGVTTFLWKAVGPPSSDYIPPLITCQAQGALGGDSLQAASNMAIRNEKWECLHDMSKSKNENNHHDLSFSVVRSLDDHMSLDHEVKLSVRCKKKFNLQCQREGDSHSAASGSEEERWCYAKSRAEIHSTKISEERRTMQSEWRTEVKQMARRVASGQLELGSPYPASEFTSESEAESIKEAFQHVTVRVQKSQDQQRYRWQMSGNVEPWDLGSEDRSESEASDLESSFRSSGGRSCHSPSQDEQAESGITIRKNSVLPQQVESLSRGHSRELYCSLNSSSDVSEEFLSPDYFLPPTTQGSSELEVKIMEKKGVKLVSRTSDVSYTTYSVIMFLFGLKKSSKSGYSNCQNIFQYFRSVTDIQDLSSITCEQENYYRDVDCKTPRASHAPTCVSTPLSAEEKIPLAFEKYKHYQEVASDSSFCGSQEISSTVSKTFITACEEGRSTEAPLVASGICSSELNEPV
ncbi:TEX14 kinase, partial [Halcyon senegalensis]|nr:TEX14 kinase [Halcyon senegalensis]